KNFNNSKNIYKTYLDSEKDINEKLKLLKVKNSKIKILNPIEKEYEELINKRNLNKNMKKFSDIANEIKNSISNFNSNDSLNSIEKNLKKLKDINNDYSDIYQKI